MTVYFIGLMLLIMRLYSLRDVTLTGNIRLKGNSKRISGSSLSPLGDQIKNFGSATQTLLTGVRLPL